MLSAMNNCNLAQFFAQLNIHNIALRRIKILKIESYSEKTLDLICYYSLIYLNGKPD